MRIFNRFFLIDIRTPPQYALALVTLTFDLLTLKVVCESRVTLTTSVPILVFLGLSVLDLGPMYATERRHMSDAHRRLMPPPYEGEGVVRLVVNKTL